VDSAAPARTFYYGEMILATAVFTAVFVLIARDATPDPGGRPIGIGAAVLAMAMTYLDSLQRDEPLGCLSDRGSWVRPRGSCQGGSHGD
jgi:hypothetical protein